MALAGMSIHTRPYLTLSKRLAPVVVVTLCSLCNLFFQRIARCLLSPGLVYVVILLPSSQLKMVRLDPCIWASLIWSSLALASVCGALFGSVSLMATPCLSGLACASDATVTDVRLASM